MIFLAITPTGLKNAMQVADANVSAIWCGSDAISETDYVNIKDHNVSRFDYALGGQTQKVLDRALETIEDHHPNEIIWLENVREL